MTKKNVFSNKDMTIEFCHIQVHLGYHQKLALLLENFITWKYPITHSLLFTIKIPGYVLDNVALNNIGLFSVNFRPHHIYSGFLIHLDIREQKQRSTFFVCTHAALSPP